MATLAPAIIVFYNIAGVVDASGQGEVATDCTVQNGDPVQAQKQLVRGA